MKKVKDNFRMPRSNYMEGSDYVFPHALYNLGHPLYSQIYVNSGFN